VGQGKHGGTFRSTVDNKWGGDVASLGRVKNKREQKTGEKGGCGSPGKGISTVEKAMRLVQWAARPDETSPVVTLRDRKDAAATRGRTRFKILGASGCGQQGRAGGRHTELKGNTSGDEAKGGSLMVPRGEQEKRLPAEPRNISSVE